MMETKKKILILANSSMGLYKFRKEIIISLMETGYKVFISAPKDSYDNGGLSAVCPNIIETSFNRRGMNPLQEYFLYRKYCKMIKDVNPDTILGYTIKPNIYGNLAARKYKIPFISTVTGLGEVFINNSAASYVAKILYKLSFKHAACIFFQNNEDLEIFKSTKIISNQKTRLVPGSGVNIEEYQYTELPQDEKIHFLYIGRIFKEKGIYELLAACGLLHQKYNGRFDVTLVGSFDGNVEELVLNACSDGIIRYFDFQSDVKPFFENTHCVVLPSYKEGMSNTLLEAAAMGRPLIASDVSGCREIVDDGVNGFVCAPRSSDELYSCMERFLLLDAQEMSQMGVASRQKIERQFDRTITKNAMCREIALLTGEQPL